MNDKENKTEKADIKDKKNKNDNEEVQRYGILMSYFAVRKLIILG